jgi:hypothetical protein
MLPLVRIWIVERGLEATVLVLLALGVDAWTWALPAALVPMYGAHRLLGKIRNTNADGDALQPESGDQQG